MRARSTRSLTLFVTAALAVACAIDEVPDEWLSRRSLEGPESVILLIADTWRADHFLVSSGSIPLTPHLADLAEQAVVFSDASSVADSTAPGTAAIMSGVLPWRSGVLSNGQIIQDPIPTLSTYLQKHGYHTAALLGNRVLRPGAGFERGFSTYEVVEPADADRITDAAIEWLHQDRDPTKPFFLWLQYMDPHGPYDPPREFLSDLNLESFESLPGIPLLPKGDNTGRGGVPYYQWSFMPDADRDGRSYLMRYAAEVRFFDREVGRLLRYLDDRGILDETLLVVTSDHGEALNGDHGFFFSHDNGLTEDQIRVPLMLYYPGCDRGSVLNFPVSTLSILPTILGVLGLPPFEFVDGHNLLDSTSRPVLAQKRREASLRKGRWKITWRRSVGFRLFDLVSDPQETQDTSKQHPGLFQELRTSLQHTMQRVKLAEPQGRRSKSEEELRALEALGYV